MGKKGGKKGKLEKSIETVESSLPIIIEEQIPLDEKSEPTESKKNLETPNEKFIEPTPRESILKPRSESLLRSSSSKKQQSLVAFEDTENIGDDIKVEAPEDDPQMPVDIVVEESDEEKPEKRKKSRKEKIQKDSSEDEEQEGKPKKNKKVKKSKKGEGEDTKNVKTSSKTEVLEEATEEAPTVITATETEEAIEESKPAKKVKKEKEAKGKKGQKNKKEIEDVGEAIEKKRRGSKRDSKATQESLESAEAKSIESDRRRSSRALGKDESMTKKPKIKAARKKSKGEMKLEDEKNEEKADKKQRNSRHYSALRLSMHGRKKRGSIVSSESSASGSEVDMDLVELPLKAKGKKKKGKKKEPVIEEELDEEEKERRRIADEEEKARKKAEKLAEKKAKKQAIKEAKKSARKEAEEKKKSDKEKEEDILKKKIDELKKEAKEMGIRDSEIALTKGFEEGLKKKVSKKEKAKLTAEMAEKAKAEMEAQAKRIEELVKKKKEEERLAAIEKDKKEILEQELRIEQLEKSNEIIKHIVDVNEAITKTEKELLEWQKYVECGRLPNPALVDQMTTYLHLWELDMENTSMDDASKRTADVIQLLNDLEELMDTITEEDYHKLENWKWIRQLFREYQAASLDVATYRLMRNVEHNLNRINIPTADYNYQSDHVTLSLWLRVMLPIPLPNPRRPPKPRIDVSFDLMNMSVLFPITIDCEDAAIRAMYLKYDHLSDLSYTFNMPEVPPDYYMDLLEISKKEWRTMLKYKYNNRDRAIIKPHAQETESIGENLELNVQGEKLEEKKIKFEGIEEEFGSEDEIPVVPFKQLHPTASEHAMIVEDELYSETRRTIILAVPENVINLRKFVILGGVFHLNLLAQPPQPQDFITMEMTITGLYLPKELEIVPFEVIYTPYIPPEPEPTDSSSSIRKLPEELEEEQKKQEEELDKLILINIKWPKQVIFLELPTVCRWDEENQQWTNEQIHDVKHNEDKCMLSFRTGVFGIYGLAAYRYTNLPFQAYDIKPEVDDSVTVQLTAAILMLEFNIKDGLIAITQLQNSPNMTLQNVIGKYMKLHKLKRIMIEAGIDIFPSFDAFCYVDGSCEKQWAMEKHLYYNMALISNSFNFAWSRWNLQAGRRKIVMQMKNYTPEKGKQNNHQMVLVTPLQVTFIECTEVSQIFTDKEVEGLKFCADLWHLMKITSGIFIRNRVNKASKQNVHALAQFLIATRILSFS